MPNKTRLDIYLAASAAASDSLDCTDGLQVLELKVARFKADTEGDPRDFDLYEQMFTQLRQTMGNLRNQPAPSAATAPAPAARPGTPLPKGLPPLSPQKTG